MNNLFKPKHDTKKKIIVCKTQIWLETRNKWKHEHFVNLFIPNKFVGKKINNNYS